MKVALCLFGHFRTFDRCYDNLLNHVLMPYQPDVFAAAWVDTMGYWQPRHVLADPFTHQGYHPQSPGVTKEYVDEVVRVLQPRGLFFDLYTSHDPEFQELANQLEQYHDKQRDPDLAPKSCLAMNWLRARSIELKKQYETQSNTRYDQVIVTRWDINHSLPIDLSRFDPNLITFEKGGGDHPGDTWAVGPSHLLDVWGDQFNGMQELIDNGTMSLSPHDWQTAWFDHKKVPWVNRTDIGTHFIR